MSFKLLFLSVIRLKTTCKLNVTQIIISVCGMIENIVEKGEILVCQHFFFFPPERTANNKVFRLVQIESCCRQEIRQFKLFFLSVIRLKTTCKLNVTQIIISVCGMIENIVEKGEILVCQHFFFFPLERTANNKVFRLVQIESICRREIKCHSNYNF